MKKSVLIILIAGSIAMLLLIAAGAKSYELGQAHPYSVASWLAAVLAFGVCAVMLSEYFIHGRQTHLYLGGAFLSLGIMGTWDAATFRYTDVFLATPAVDTDISRWTHFGLWQMQWIILTVTLLLGIFVSARANPRRLQSPVRTAAVITASVLLASLAIFATSVLPSISGLLASTHIPISFLCAIVLIIAWFAYSRSAVHRGNGVLIWMSYGLVFAALSQLAMALQTEPSQAMVGFAGLMKVLALMAPLAGMMAEHARLQVKLRDQAADLSNLIQTQQAVNSITAPTELYQRILELVHSSVPSEAVCLLPFEKDRGLLRVAAQLGLNDDTARQLVFRPGEGPPGDSFSSKETVFVANISDDPVLLQKLGEPNGISSAVFAPLVARDECLGVLALFFGGNPARKLSKDDARMLEALSNQAALAIDGFRLRGRMLDSAKTTDDYAHELELVWAIGQAVASKLELNVLVDTLAEKLRESVGARTCSVLVFEPDVVGVRIMGHQTLTRLKNIAEHLDQCDLVAATVARNNEPVMVNDVPNSCHCKYPDMALEDGGVHHVLSVPMSVRGFIGAISVFRQNTKPFTERDQRVLMRLSPMVAAGIRNADLYEREKKIADSLQSSLLPEPSRDLTGIEVEGRYQAAFDESLVGGDFYDVIDLGSGRYGIAVGDVAGKGIDAAVYTAMTRYMIQAYSADNPDPLSLVPKLNNALARYTPSVKFVTVIYGIADTNSGTFTYVNAGHELPFIYRSADGDLGTLETTGPAAGALADGEYMSRTIPFEPDDILIFYTDGATEARHEGKFLGTEGLREIVVPLLRSDVYELTSGILAGIRSFAHYHHRDDVAILVVKARAPGKLF